MYECVCTSSVYVFHIIICVGDYLGLLRQLYGS